MANQHSYKVGCSRVWYEEAEKRGAYKDLTLEGWAYEIEWRIQYQKLIEKGEKGRLEGAWSMFFDQLKLGTERTSPKLLIASEPYKPIDWLDDWNEYHPRRDKKGIDTQGVITTQVTKEGLITNFIVNQSYDDKTLLEHFKSHLRSSRKKYTNYPVELSAKRALTEDDAMTWNNQCVLQYIDFKICSEMTGCYFNKDEVSAFLGLSDTTLRQTTAKRAEKMLSGYVLGQIRASIELNKGIPLK